MKAKSWRRVAREYQQNLPMVACSWSIRHGAKPRAACKRGCWTTPAIVDAVPEGGRVRFVRARGIDDKTAIAPLRDLNFVPVPVRFEDGFMTLLHDLDP